MIIKSASRDTGCLSDIGYSDLIRSFFSLRSLKKAPRMLHPPQNIFRQKLDFA